VTIEPARQQDGVHEPEQTAERTDVHDAVDRAERHADVVDDVEPEHPAASVESERATAFKRSSRRTLVLAGVAFVVAAPYYQRNVAAYGTPFQLSRDFELVSRIESRQGPGQRTFVDYLRVSPQLFANPGELRWLKG